MRILGGWQLQPHLKRHWRTLCITPALWCLATVAFAQRYSITELNLPGAVGSYGYGINANGEVVGSMTLPNPAADPSVPLRPDFLTHAFVYSNGLVRDLGTLGGNNSVARGINSAGQIVGYSDDARFTYRAFIYSNGSMQELGTLGGDYSVGLGIANSGHAVGWAQVTTGGLVQPFIYANGSMQFAGSLGGTFGTAEAINDAGQATGYSVLPDGNYHAFLSTNGVLQDLGTLGGRYSDGHAINASGQVTGDAWINVGDTAAFLYSEGAMQSLGTLGGARSGGNGINTQGQVTGWAQVASGEAHAFLYSDGVMKDLNSMLDPSSPLALYVLLSGATAINDSGLIVANGIDLRTGLAQAFLLTPVPLPAGVWLLLSGIGFAGAMRVRRVRSVS